MSFWRACRNKYYGLCTIVILFPVAGSHWCASAQAPNVGIAQETDASKSPDFTLAGTVSNGLNGSPLPRALVRINARSVLTDSLGRFSFPTFSGTAGAAQVIKPGYSSSPDDPGTSSSIPLGELSSRHDFKLYPNAIITGLIIGSNRQPIDHVQVLLQRENLEENGQKVVQVAFAQTDLYGRYRFSEPAGRYRVLVPYAAQATEEGEAMLPVEFPQDSSSEWPAMFSVASGEERHIDLHARTAPSFPLRFRVDGDDARSNPRVSVETTSGSNFVVFARTTSEQGTYEILLPAGSYALRVTSQTRDRHTEASANVVVAGREVNVWLFHAVPLPEIPVDLAVDSSGKDISGVNGWQAPSLTSLAIRLRSVHRSDQNPGNGDVGLTTHANQPAILQASPGLYHFQVQSVGPWYVRSATYRGVDLLSQPFSVETGGSQEVRIIIANDAGQIMGKVSGASDSGVSYVYLMAHQPDPSPVLQIQTSKDGTYSRLVPPGSYSVYAFSRRLPFDPRNPEMASRLRGGTEVMVPSASKITADIESQPLEPAK